MRPGLAVGGLLLVGVAHAQDAPPPANELPPAEVKVEKPHGMIVPVSVMGGLRAGGALKLGKIAPDGIMSNPNGCPTSTSSGDACPVGGLDLALEAGALLFEHLYGGLIVGGTFLISPASTNANVSSLLFGTEFGWVTNAHGTGGFFGLGVAYRATFVSDSNGNANKYDGPDVLFTLGLHLRLASYLRLMPRIDVSLGPTANADAHEIFILGISAWFNDDLHPSKSKK